MYYSISSDPSDFTVLSILKPAGSEGATVQLVIVPPELLKVMFGSIKAWGNASTGGAGAPVGNGYTKIYRWQNQ
jgi:hypothetical protein